jgi:hypothetical protein
LPLQEYYKSIVHRTLAALGESPTPRAKFSIREVQERKVCKGAGLEPAQNHGVRVSFVSITIACAVGAKHLVGKDGCFFQYEILLMNLI